jgi:hypothetical protein
VSRAVSPLSATRPTRHGSRWSASAAGADSWVLLSRTSTGRSGPHPHSVGTVRWLGSQYDERAPDDHPIRDEHTRRGGTGQVVILPDSVHTAALAAEALGLRGRARSPTACCSTPTASRS